MRDRMALDKIEVSAVWLVKVGNKACVRVEVDGRFVDIIEEHEDGPFSHICEAGGIRSRIADGRFYDPDARGVEKST